MNEPVNREAGDETDKADYDKGQAPAQPEILREDGHDPGKARFAFGFHATIFNQLSGGKPRRYDNGFDLPRNQSRPKAKKLALGLRNGKAWGGHANALLASSRPPAMLWPAA
jgi:hypothetical protein